MVVSYVLQKPFLDHEAGAVIQLDQDEAAPLVEAGILAEATADDVAGNGGDGGEEVSPEAEALAKKIESAVVKATEAAVSKVARRQRTGPDFQIPAEAKDTKGGFKDFGDFCRGIAFAHHGDWNAQRKLNAFRTKAPTGASEGTNADGGYAVIPEWTNEIFDKARQHLLLTDYTQKYSIGGQTLNVPAINETSRADGSRFGGIQSYYIGEGNTFTGSKLGLTQVSLTLNKLGVFCYLTNELINDNAFNLTNYLQDKVALEIMFKTNDGLINGSGSSQPTGILNAASLVTVATSSGAATVTYTDLVNMWNRLYYMSRPNANWFTNQEVHAQLLSMVFTSGGSTSAFGGLTFSAHDEFPMRIFGRPVITVENCAALGSPGDIILADLSQYAVIEKPLNVAVSTEYHFNQDEVVYRFVYRWDAKSPWTSALTPYKGSKTTSPFIVLANRGT